MAQLTGRNDFYAPSNSKDEDRSSFYGGMKAKVSSKSEPNSGGDSSSIDTSTSSQSEQGIIAVIAGDGESDDDCDESEISDDFSASGGTCAGYAPDKDGCHKPRSCVDCLNTPASSIGEECMIGKEGYCESADLYDAKWDYRDAIPINKIDSKDSSEDDLNASYVFRASDVNYCPNDDPICTECRKTIFASTIAGKTDDYYMSFCVGENGCVCIAGCERMRLHPPKEDRYCPMKALSPHEEEEKEEGPRYALVFGGIGVLIMCMFIIMAVRSARKSRSTSECASDVDDNRTIDPEEIMSNYSLGDISTVSSVNSLKAVRGQLLNLFSWQSTGGDRSTERNVQFRDSAPSAPIETTELATAPPLESEAGPGSSVPVVVAIRCMTEPSAPELDDEPSAPDYELMNRLSSEGRGHRPQVFFQENFEEEDYSSDDSADMMWM